MSGGLDALVAHIVSKPGAQGDRGPGPARGVTLYKVMGKMFAILSASKSPYVILKADPHLIEILKERYEGVGTGPTSTGGSGSR